jgi:hypothetical protein
MDSIDQFVADAILGGWRRAKLCGVEARQLAKRRASALRQPANKSGRATPVEGSKISGL